MKNENYTFPVILDFSDEEDVILTFPTLEDDMTCVKKGEDYVKEAQDFLALSIANAEDEGKELSSCLQYNANGKLNDDQELIYVNIWMPYHRSTIKEIYTKKTLTIPMWLDILAKESNINFSATLVEALKKKLGL